MKIKGKHAQHKKTIYSPILNGIFFIETWLIEGLP
jgi:hypothetical protein